MATGLNSLEPWLQPAAVQLVNIAASAGLSPKVSSARRSHAQQALLYRRYLAGQSRFPAAPPGNSMHELGLAFDLWINDESQLSDLGEVWEKDMGGVWGGHFKDPIHFEAGGDLTDYAAQAVQETLQEAPQSTIEVPSYITSTTEILRYIPILGSLGVPTSEFLGLDPPSVYRKLKSWGLL